MIMAADPTGRPPAKSACIYWGTNNVCTATDYFDQEDISCYNLGNCDGFGTCRGCSKYDRGGLKFSFKDSAAGETQTPMNLKMYNIRAKASKCCNWEGDTVEFKVGNVRAPDSTGLISYSGATNNGAIIIQASAIPEAFPQTFGRAVLKKEGQNAKGDNYTTFNITYNSRTEDTFEGVTTSSFEKIVELDPDYTIFLSKIGSTPILKPKSHTVDTALSERTTGCKLVQAAPWQEGFTDENPYALGCNGAKQECPFYTGPDFTEVVDAKMDTGDRISAKQIMELRFYSRDWNSLDNPVEIWESTFSEPYIWAWARDLEASALDSSIWKGKIDELTGKPLIQKVEVGNLKSKLPNFVVGQPTFPEQGAPVVGGPASYPTLIKELEDLSSESKVLFPKNTTLSSPYVKKAFTHDDRFFYVSALLDTSRDVFAVNLSKHSQGNLDDELFLKQLKLNSPDDIYTPFSSSLPGSTFNVELTTDGSTRRVNHIRIFIDSGIGELDSSASPAPGSLIESEDNVKPALPTGDRKFIKMDVFVEFIFYHSHVAQDFFSDQYGHSMVDPWINHFTRFQAAGEILNLTGNSKFNSVYWNTISSEGKKSMYSIEEQKETGSDDPSEIEWEVLDCNHVLVTFLNKGVNRTAPWAAWGKDSKDVDLYVKVDRTANSDVTDNSGEAITPGFPTEVELELVLATTKGSILPANVAIFKVNEDINIGKPFDTEKDTLRVRYAYTEYRQGPITEEDELKIKHKSDLDDKVIDMFPYEVTTESNRFNIEGTFIKIGDNKVYSCEEVIGDCFSLTSKGNEAKARIAFARGGIGDDEIKTISQMTSECVEEFESKYGGALFEDGVEITYPELSKRLGDLNLKEGSLHFLFVFEDEEGRPIGVKNTAMLTQSSLAQARDVEIKYDWLSQIKHYPNHSGDSLLASSYAPLYASTCCLYQLFENNEPKCGTHAETTGSRNGFIPYSLETDGPGALWYPYNHCEVPHYSVKRPDNASPAEYDRVVEGFDEGKRRSYWERMRTFDKYTPFIISFINRIGCLWAERTSTAEAYGPFTFLGYTKIRSMHLFGRWATDRESLRVSRHWEKRNLTIEEETLTEEDGAYTLTLSENFENILLNDSGGLNTGSDLQTPVWVHINDGYSVVSPTSESLLHPFGHYILSRTGTHQFGEQYVDDDDNRHDLNIIFEEKDYTTTVNRSVDGTKIYTSDGTEINVEGGLLLKEDAGRDIRYVFAKESAQGATPVWAWMASPPDLERNNRLVNGVSIKNPESTFFCEDRTPANFTDEGAHELAYTPHTFDPDGKLLTAAYITLDDGPKLFVIFKSKALHPLVDGEDLYILQENDAPTEDFEALGDKVPSPYDSREHEDTDYTFVLSASSSPGRNYQVLADSKGIRKYKIGEETYGTFSGVLINSSVNIDELPYEVLTVGKNSGFGMGQDTIDEALKVYEDNSSFSVGKIDLKGHYFVESIEVFSIYGGEFEVPTIQADGVLYGEESNTTLFPPSARVPSEAGSLGTSYHVTFPVNARLKSVTVSFGARATGKKFKLDSIIINYRQPVAASESIFTYAPKANVSIGNTGTHKPSDLEFYFSRSVPDFAKSYAGGDISLLETDFEYSITPLPTSTIKYNSRLVKDILPHFEFSDPTGDRFAFDNLDITTIPGYTEDPEAFGGTARFITGEVKTGGKGWTMYTKNHEDDPGGSLTHKNSFSGNLPLHDLQKNIYNDATKLLGDAVSIYKNFWHPKEIEVLALYGVNLESYSWELELNSIAADLRRIFRHKDYGCYNQATSEYYDGEVHTIENWNARGAFHYQCDPKFNHGCYAIVMNKCNYFFWEDYKTDKYLDNNVIQRFTQTFSIPIDDYQGYLSAGLIDSNYISGTLGGIVPTSAAATSAGLSSYNNFRTFHNEPQNPTKPGEFQ